MRLEEIVKSKLKRITDSNLYVLRLRFLQLFAKYMGFEKREPLLKVEWDIFFKRYKMLIEEFESRELKYNQRGIDKELEKTKKFFIKILKECNSILVNIDNNSILIDPTIHKKDLQENVDYIIVTKKEDNNCEFLEEYEKVPIYSIGKILDELPIEEKHLLMKPLQITKNESVIAPIKISKKLIGVKITKGDIEVSVLPELFPLTKKANDLIAKTVWIAKVHDYENDGVTGELSFVNLMELAEELKPTKIYLVNLEKNVLKYKEKIDEALEKWAGRILEDGEVLDESSFRISKPETTENYHRIPVLDCKITATIDISTKEGIKALYCGEEKKIATYLFDVNKWTMERAKKWVEEQKTKKVDEKAEMFNCECIECGYKMQTVVHCKNIKCPKCGGQMRREERPGPGQQSSEEATMGSGKEKPTEEAQEAEKKVKKDFEFGNVKVNFELVNEKDKKEKVKKDAKIDFKFQKISKAEHIVGGVIYHSNVEDAQGDGTTEKELWKALKRYMIKGKNIKVMHKGIKRDIPIIENYFVEEDHHKGGTDEQFLLKKGDWWLAVYLGDKSNKDIWTDVISKKLNGFSMAGVAQSD